MAKKITKLTKNAAFYLGKCIWWPLVKDFMPNHHPPSDHYPRALLPRLLVQTNFGDGLQLKRQYLNNHASDPHDKHIDTKVYPLGIQS